MEISPPLLDIFALYFTGSIISNLSLMLLPKLKKFSAPSFSAVTVIPFSESSKLRLIFFAAISLPSTLIYT